MLFHKLILTLLTSLTLLSFSYTQTYQQTLTSIKNKKLSMTTTAVSYDSIKTYLTHQFINVIYPHWKVLSGIITAIPTLQKKAK